MGAQGLLQVGLLFAILTALTPLLGAYMARVYTGERVLLTRVFGPGERLLYRLLRVDPASEQDWKGYARSTVLFTLVGFVVLYVLLRIQSVLPGNPHGFGGMPWDVAFNTAASFVSNTNWQFYAGETTMANVTQMVGLTVQNFVSAAVGMAVLIAVIRGITRSSSRTIGNFWVDVTRGVLYVLLPMSFVLALALVSQGVVQTLAGSVAAVTLAGADQVISLGPAASQVAIKQLGTNGGGFFNTNSAHPLENTTAFSNVLQVLSILLIPAALTATYGRMVGNRRQGWAIYGAMGVLFVAGTLGIYAAQSSGTPALAAADVATHVDGGDRGNLQDSEVRNGVAATSFWASATTAASNGSVSGGHEAMNGYAAAVLMANMATGEVVFGGVGSGLYGMLLFILLAVFLAGLMVGRTPEYLGKKLGAREMKFVLVGTLVPGLMVLVLTALSLATKWGEPSVCGEGVRGFTETLYAYLSQGNNNGSAFACFTGFVQPEAPGNDDAFGISFAAILGGLAMLVSRLVPMLAVLAIAGALAAKRTSSDGAGTLRTDTATFGLLVVGTVLLVALLTFVPALLLGPVAEGLTSTPF